MARTPARKSRVLVVHKPVMGGASESLLGLVAAVRHAVEPVVLFHWENEYVERLARTGVRTLVLHAGRTRTAGGGARRGQAASAARLRSSDAEFVPLREPQPPRTAGRGWRESLRLLRREIPIARRIARVIRAERPALVHHNNNPYADRSSILGAAMVRVPQLAHVRSLPPYFAPIDARLCARLRATVCVSEAARRHHASRLRLESPLLDVVYDPVVSAGELATTDPGELRRRLGLPPRADSPGARTDAGPLLLNVGRQVPLKGQDLFLRAAARVLADHPRGQALLVGARGSTREGLAWRMHLEDLTRELGLVHRVHFLEDRDDVLEVMRACDVLVHTPTGPEAFGRVLAEALSVGLPVVTTDTGGVEEIVRDGVTGRLVRRTGGGFRVADVAGAVAATLADPSAHSRMAAEGRRWVEERLDLRTHGEAMAELYGRCMGGG